ncbi:MAG TPA: hypothetical protein VMI55_08290 [Thermoplasmata archaeon]|nr:hypothetical protein [Thermoplasmata archaeon]
MAGCGTSALITVALGRDAIVSDIDPLACLLTRAKCTPVDPGELMVTVEGLLDRVGPMGYRKGGLPSAEECVSEMERKSPFRAPPNPFHWFHPTILRDLARWLLEVHSYGDYLDYATRDAVLAITAGSIRRVSRADPKPVSGLEVTSVRRERLRAGLRFDLRGELLARAAILCEGYSQLLSRPRLGEVTVYEWDARRWAALCARVNRFPDLQISSPPYLRAINYARRHKLENFLLGLVNQSDFTARARRFLGTDVSDGLSAVDVESRLTPLCKTICSRVARLVSEHDAVVLGRYLIDVDDWLSQVADVSRESRGIAYVIVGASSVGDVQIDTPKLLVELAARRGLALTYESRHSLVNQRMQYTLRQGYRVGTESVLQFTPNN